MRLSTLWAVEALCLLFLLAPPLQSVSVGAEQARPKRVLIISTGSRLAPGFMLVDQQLLQALQNIQAVPIETYAENLDTIRFPAKHSQRIFGEYLTAKYADFPPDLVILVYVGNLGFPGKLLPKLFPATPIIVAGLTEEELRTNQFSSFISGIAQRVDPRATLELIVRMQPEVRRVVVIGGTAEVDRHVLQRVKEVAQSFEGRIAIEFWDNLRMADIQKAVTTVPRDTAILYARLFRDAAGQAFVSSEIARLIAQSANAPVYVMSDASLGTGAVGGSVASTEAFGKRAGELARLILTGTAPASLPFEIRTDSVPMFDWRALKKWGISESRLPPDSVVLFRPQSIWNQYRWYIVGALIIICVQGAMIADLLAERRRRFHVQQDLKQSQQMMELATGAGEVGLWSRELPDGSIWLNAPMRSLFGFSANDAVRFEDILARVHPDDRNGMSAQVRQADTAGLPFAGEFRILCNGAERWVLAKGRTTADPTLPGDERRMGAILEITERKRSEEKLRESEQRFRAMADAAPVMIWMSGTDKLCTFFNKSWLDFTGRTFAQECGNGWIKGVHEEDVTRCLEFYVNAFDARQEFTMEYRLRRYDGEYRWVLDRGVPRLGHDDAFLGYVGTAMDITEHKRSVEALHQSEEHYRTLAETAADVIVTLDENSTILYANAAVESVFGYDPTELIGQSLTLLMPEPLRQQHIEGMRRYLESGEKLLPWDAVAFSGLHKGGREISLEIAFGVSRIDDRRVFTGIMRDVTERKRTEAELQEQRAELAHVARISTMGELAASLAHELNQPLTAILSNAQAALRFLSGKPAEIEEVRETLQDIVKDNNRASEVIRRMRSLVKKEALEFAPLDFAGLIREVVVLVHSDAILQNTRITLELADNLPALHGDKIQLQQVVLNLLLNAFDAMKDCPAARREVQLRVERNGMGSIQAAVSDLGTGLSGDKLDKIFQPFYTTKGEGLGMGLSICRSIIEAHGGRLWAENNPDHGATFYFTVPAAGEAKPRGVFHRN